MNHIPYHKDTRFNSVSFHNSILLSIVICVFFPTTYFLCFVITSLFFLLSVALIVVLFFFLNISLVINCAALKQRWHQQYVYPKFKASRYRTHHAYNCCIRVLAKCGLYCVSFCKYFQPCWQPFTYRIWWFGACHNNAVFIFVIVVRFVLYNMLQKPQF